MLLSGRASFTKCDRNRDRCFYFDGLAVQEIGLVFVLSNSIENRLAGPHWAGNHLRKKNFPVLIYFKAHNDGACHARSCYGWIADLNFVDE